MGTASSSAAPLSTLPLRIVRDEVVVLERSGQPLRHGLSGLLALVELHLVDADERPRPRPEVRLDDGDPDLLDVGGRDPALLLGAGVLEPELLEIGRAHV